MDKQRSHLEEGVGDHNLFAFCRNDPVDNVDRLGLWTDPEFPHIIPRNWSPPGPPGDPNFDKARNWMLKCHPELKCPDTPSMLPLVFGYDGLTVFGRPTVAPGLQDPSEYVDTIAHEALHCKRGAVWGAAHDQIYSDADMIRREYDRDPDGNKCKCQN